MEPNICYVYTVYGLVEPRGAKDANKRFKEHRDRGSDEIRCWIQDLESLGLEPYACFLEQTDSRFVDERERYWIAEMAKHWPLFNRVDNPNERPRQEFLLLPMSSEEKSALLAECTKQNKPISQVLRERVFTTEPPT